MWKIHKIRICTNVYPPYFQVKKNRMLFFKHHFLFNDIIVAVLPDFLESLSWITKNLISASLAGYITPGYNSVKEKCNSRHDTMHREIWWCSTLILLSLFVDINSLRAGGDAEASFMSAETMCISVKMWLSGSAAIGWWGLFTDSVFEKTSISYANRNV